MVLRAGYSERARTSGIHLGGRRESTMKNSKPRTSAFIQLPTAETEQAIPVLILSNVRWVQSFVNLSSRLRLPTNFVNWWRNTIGLRRAWHGSRLTMKRIVTWIHVTTLRTCYRGEEGHPLTRFAPLGWSLLAVTEGPVRAGTRWGTRFDMIEYNNSTRPRVWCPSIVQSVHDFLGDNRQQLLQIRFHSDSPLTRTDIDLAGWLQTHTFVREIADLKSKRGLARSRDVWVPFSTKGDSLEWEESYNERTYRHPVILPRGEYLTKLLLRCEHERLLHAGCEAVLSSIHWPFLARSTLRGVIRNCSRTEPRTTSYQ